MTRRHSAVALAIGVVIGAILVTGWWLWLRADLGTLSAETRTGEPASGVTISGPSDAPPPAALAGLGAVALTGVFEVTSSSPPAGEVVLRFGLTRSLTAEEKARVAVADQSVDGGGWVVTPAVFAGEDVVYAPEHFSKKQVLLFAQDAKDGVTASYDWFAKFVGARADGSCPGGEASPYRADISAPGSSSAPPVLACPGQPNDEGRPTLTLANQRGIAMDVLLPEGARVEAVSSAGLTEDLWADIYGFLGTESAWIPGGGTMTVSFSDMPARLELTANNSALPTDVILALAARGRFGGTRGEQAAELAEIAACADRVSDTSEISAGADAWDPMRDVWEDCGGTVSEATNAGGFTRGLLDPTAEFLFAIPKAAIGGLDSLRAVTGTRETIRFRTKSGTSFRAPSPGYVARFDMEWATASGERAEGVLEIGRFRPLSEAISEGYVPQCFNGDETRAGYLNGYFQLTSRTPGFDMRLLPRLVPKKFEIVRGAFTGDDIGTQITDDRGWDTYGVAIESLGECRNPWSATQTMYGAYTLSEGQSTEQVAFDLVYNNIYGPSRPQGDPEYIETLGLYLNPGLTIFNDGLECISGPGAGLGGFVPVTGGDSMVLGEKYRLDTDRLRMPGCL